MHFPDLQTLNETIQLSRTIKGHAVPQEINSEEENSCLVHSLNEAQLNDILDNSLNIDEETEELGLESINSFEPNLTAKKEEKQ